MNNAWYTVLPNRPIQRMAIHSRREVGTVSPARRSMMSSAVDATPNRSALNANGVNGAPGPLIALLTTLRLTPQIATTAITMRSVRPNRRDDGTFIWLIVRLAARALDKS